MRSLSERQSPICSHRRNLLTIERAKVIAVGRERERESVRLRHFLWSAYTIIELQWILACHNVLAGCLRVLLNESLRMAASDSEALSKGALQIDAQLKAVLSGPGHFCCFLSFVCILALQPLYL